jgi:hypothetical protein
MSCLVLRGATVGATVVMALALGACARDADRSVGTTTITRAVVDPEPVATAPQPASWRLAGEICKRRASCEAGDEGGSSVGAVADGDCIERERASAQKVLSSWNCSPAAERARLEECLVSMRTARCEPLLSDATHLPTCRANVTCGPPVVP